MKTSEMKNESRLDSANITLLFSSIGIAYLIFKMIGEKASGIWITLLSILLSIVVYSYVKKVEIKVEKSFYICLIYNLLLALSFSIFENTILKTINLWFLILSNFYWIASISYSRESDMLDTFVTHFLKSIFVTPFKNMSSTIKQYSLIKFLKKNKSFGYILIGVLISLPLLGLVIALLVSSDELFKTWIIKAIDFFINNFSYNALLLLISFPFGCYLFLYINKNVSFENIPIRKKSEYTVPTMIFLTTLVIFIFIYVVYLLSSFISFFSFQKEPITALSVSSYARNGFFELLVVVLINMGIFLLVKTLADKKNKQISITLSFIGIETLGLIFISFSKMQLYISRFGLTGLRLNTSFFMIVLFLCVILFLISLWKKIDYAVISIILVAFTILGISYSNSGNFIVSYNYKKYEEEKISDLDVSVFYSLGADALPMVYEIYQGIDDSLIKEDLEKYFSFIETEISSRTKNTINYSRFKALNIIDTLKEKNETIE